MLLVALRVVLFLLALVLPGGLLFIAGAAMLRRSKRSRRQRRAPELDFETGFRRAPATLRGRHGRVLIGI